MTMTRFPKIKEKLYKYCLELICEEGYTPYIGVYTAHPDYTGTRKYETVEGLTVFNISVKSLAAYNSNSSGVTFSATFAGVHTDVVIPWEALASVFAKEDTSIAQRFAITIVTSGVGAVPVAEPAKLTLVKSGDKSTGGVSRSPFKPKLIK